MDDEHFKAEKYESSVSALIDDYKGFAELTPAQKEDLITVFGCPKVEVKSPEAIRPPSPSESITITQNNLKKLKEKGFMHSTETDDFDQQLLQRKLFEYKAEKKQKKDDAEFVDIENTMTSDPEMRRWLQTDTVQTITAEMQSLPFIDGIFLYQTLNRFYYAITAYVRKQRTFRPKRVSDRYLHDEMYNFVLEAKKLRSELLARAITNNMIFVKKMDPKYLDEFKDAIEDLKVKLEAARQNLLLQQKQEEALQKNSKNNNHDKEKDEEEQEKAENEKKGPKRGQENFDLLESIDNNQSSEHFSIAGEMHHNHHSKSQEADLSFLEHAKATIDPMPFVYEMDTNYFKDGYLKQKEDQMLSAADHLKQKYPYQNLFISKQTSASTNQLLPLNEPEKQSILKTPSNLHKKSYSAFPKKPFSILGFKPPVKIVVPQVQPKTAKKSNSALDFWISNDPLTQNREGKPVDIFNQFQTLTNIDLPQNEPDPEECSNFPHLMVQDYRPPTAVLVENKDAMITDRIWSTSQMADPSLPPTRNSSKANSKSSKEPAVISHNDSSVTFTTTQKTINPYVSKPQLTSKPQNSRDKGKSKYLSNSSDDEGPPTFNGFTAEQLMQNTNSIHNSETFKYLIAHTPFDSDKMGASSRQFAILQSYMSELGFNTYQKLELYKKYSSNVELMNKIGEYLPYWQHAIDTLHSFEKVYHELRTYMETCLSISEAEPFLKSSYSNLEMVSNTLQEAGDRLKLLADDTLFLRGKNYLEYIERKKRKIQQVKQEREQEEIIEKQKEKQKPQQQRKVYY